MFLQLFSVFDSLYNVVSPVHYAMLVGALGTGIFFTILGLVLRIPIKRMLRQQEDNAPTAMLLTMSSLTAFLVGVIVTAITVLLMFVILRLNG